MWWSCAKSSLRALYRDRLYTSVNIVGLSVGMACCLVLGLYLHSQLTYDLHHEKHEQIYRVAVEYAIEGRADAMAKSSPLLGPTLAKDHSDFSKYVRFRPFSTGEQSAPQLVRHKDKAYYWRDIYLADPTVFDIFTHDVLAGDTETALTSPNSAAVSRTFAERYFAGVEAVGRTVTLESGEEKEITLVYEDLPQNSHLRYDVLLSYPPSENVVSDLRDFWRSSDFTYLLLRQEYDARDFQVISSDIFERYMREHGDYLNGHWIAWLQPLADIHLHSGLVGDRPTANRSYLYGISAVALFILLIACINYVNLSTARATKRAHEIGMRKILGASRTSLAIQFLAESLVLSLIAMAVALFLLRLSTEVTEINQTLGISLLSYLDAVPSVYLWMVAGSLLIGVTAGLYPAYYLSSIAPLSALVSATNSAKRSVRFREVLVLLQFAISIGVTGATIVMHSQMKFLANKPLGFEREGRLVITLRGADLIQKLPVLADELSRSERVLSVTASDRLVGGAGSSTYLETEDNDGQTVNRMTQLMPVARNFLPAMGIQIVSGRNFLPTEAPDSSIIVNEAVVRQMNWENPLGKRMGLRGRTVIGVVRDFNYESLHSPVEPMAIYPYRTDFSNLPAERRPHLERYAILNVALEDLDQTMSFIETTMNRFDPARPFRFQFLDSIVQRQYMSEQRLVTLSTVFAVICIFLACLGQFGLTAYTTAARTKEIGIRKVLGASAFQILLLLYKRILVIATVGALVAIPLSYRTMDAWLSTFTYGVRADLGAFLVATIAMIGISAITIALQSLSVMRKDPVQALRYE